MRRALLYVGGWLLAVVVATGVGFAAISLVGDNVGAPGNGVALIATPQASPSDASADQPRPHATATGTTSPAANPTSTDPANDRSAAATQVTDAGTVTGLCRSGGARFVSWSPKNGWSVVDVDLTGTKRSVSFSDGTRFVTVTLRCVAGTPVFGVVTTDASPTPQPTSSSTPTPTDTASVQSNPNG